MAASALLGGAIGLPVGLAAGMIYDHYSKRSATELQVDEIKNNQREILARQREIDAMREELQGDIPLGNPSDSRLEYRYMGPSLGNPYR